MRKRFCTTVLFLAMVLTACGTGQYAETAPPFTETPQGPTLTAAPTPSLVLGPDITPEAVSTPRPTPELISSPVLPEGHNDGYFDSAVFIGDSIMEGVRQYVAKHRSVEPTLGQAVFLTSVSGISLADLGQDGVGYHYQGEDMPLQDILTQMDCTRIFLLLGLNDLAAADPEIEKIIADYSRLIDLLREAVPDVEVIVMTNTPKVSSNWLPDYTANRSFGNPLIAEFVDALIQMCDSRGIAYVDTYQALKDETGALPDDCCRDGFLHLNDNGAKLVVDALYEYASWKS